jgi:aspartyl-tRNA(Asn)/glutamyl-tRNA(Gln) amidotransferase subunit B
VWLGVNDGNMEEGSLRCDANVSVRRIGASGLGTKTEVKNVNSFRYLEKALTYEIGRQIDLVEHGGQVAQETRLFDAALGRTHAMRSKEESHDYRYFPEPDLPPLVVDQARQTALRARLPELPEARRERFVEALALPAYDAELLTQSRGIADYFEATARESGNAKAASNWVMGEILRTMKERDLTIDRVPVRPPDLAGLIGLVERAVISSTVAKEVFARMLDTGRSAQAIVDEEGLAQIGDTDALAAIVREVVAAHPDAVTQVRKGRNNAFGFLVGQVMKASKGKANPKIVNQLLTQEISTEVGHERS